jgi:hypothetical protein
MLSPELVQTIYLPLLGVVLTALVGIACKKFEQWTGIQIEAKHREALQSALENGARLALNRLAVDSLPTLTPDQVAQQYTPILQKTAVDYVQQSVPDAVNFFGLTPERIGELVLTKLVLPRFGINL